MSIYGDESPIRPGHNYTAGEVRLMHPIDGAKRIPYAQVTFMERLFLGEEGSALGFPKKTEAEVAGFLVRAGDRLTLTTFGRDAIIEYQSRGGSRSLRPVAV